MIEFDWETIGGLAFGIELIDNPGFNVQEDNLKWLVVIYLGIIRIAFSKYVLEG